MAIGYIFLKCVILEFTLPYLRKKAKLMNIKNYSSMNKENLVNTIVYTFAMRKIQQFIRKYCLPKQALLESKRYILSFDIGIKNLAYCLMNEHEQIIDWGIRDISANTYSKQNKKLIQSLDSIRLSHCDSQHRETIVIIERQPGVNPKMRVISGQLFMYFGLKEYRNQGISKVLFYSPRNKLKLDINTTGIVMKKYSTKYQERKHLSKVYCRILLRDHNLHWIPFFNDSKKQDDLSDSMLQGIAYLRGLK